MIMDRQRVFLLLLILFCAPCLQAQERHVDPTWLHRFVPDLPETDSDVTAAGCRYRAIFGAGDPQSRIVRGIARYGEMTVEPGGSSADVSYLHEEQVYVVLEGQGTLRYGGKTREFGTHDFVYLPPGVPHGVSNPSAKPFRAIVMGFRIPRDEKIAPTSEILMANIDDVPKQVVGGHPPSTLFQLLMGTTESKRDKLAAAHVLTSLFVMEFDAGGTNFPHHHDREEEIYLVLDGNGDMVAGGGTGGTEGRHPAKAGDAWFFRLNCTVGFYSKTEPGGPKARILAVRSRYPF